MADLKPDVLGSSPDTTVPSNSRTKAKEPQYLERLPNTVYGREEREVKQNIRIENFVGFAQVPLGVAGPLTIHGENQRGTFHAPLATTEPTLVASCSRGCKAFESDGGIHAVVLQEGMSRAPVFSFVTVQQAVFFYRLVPSLETEWRVAAEKTSRFAKLRHVTPHIFGRRVHVKFTYTCGDAAGQNMTTIATHVACQKLVHRRGQELGITRMYVEGQLAGDKKMTFVSVHEPRGVQVLVWGTLSDKTCRAILGNSTQDLHAGLMVGLEGAVRAGMSGNNINTANIIAAMFVATGQDAASVLESGWTQLCSDYDPDTMDLHLSLFIPSLIVGSVGGGTAYSTQKEALDLIGCAGEGKKWALAETIASFALALEVSTMSAIIDDTFTKSHQRLARSNKL